MTAGSEPASLLGRCSFMSTTFYCLFSVFLLTHWPMRDVRSFTLLAGAPFLHVDDSQKHDSDP